MPRLNVDVAHTLAHDEAQQRMRTFVTRLLVQFGGKVSDVRQEWNGNTLAFGFRLYGAALDGEVLVGERSVGCALNFPLAALAFKGKAEDAIRTELTQALA